LIYETGHDIGWCAIEAPEELGAMLRTSIAVAGMGLLLAACGANRLDRGMSGGAIGAGLGAATSAVTGGDAVNGAVFGGAAGAATGVLTS
jgi:hypothetical protein